MDAQGHPVIMSDEDGGAGDPTQVDLSLICKRAFPHDVPQGYRGGRAACQTTAGSCHLLVRYTAVAACNLEEKTRLQKTTAFDETVWASIDDQRQLSTCEFQAAVDTASKADRKPKKKKQKPRLSRMLPLIL